VPLARNRIEHQNNVHEKLENPPDVTQIVARPPSP